jgi:hypothetical protein
MREIGCLKNLKVLNLSNRFQITDESLKGIEQLTNLQELNLADSSGNFGIPHGITDASLQVIRQLKSLSKLDLSYTRITPAGWAELQGLTNLKSLTLSFAFIVDPNVPPVKKPANEPAVIREFRQAMKKAVPDCTIEMLYLPLAIKRDGDTRKGP